MESKPNMQRRHKSYRKVQTMHILRTKSKFAVLAISITLVLTFAMAINVDSSLSTPATSDAVVIGSKQHYLNYQDNYLFESGANLVLEAPEISEWTFDQIEVDFGCEVGGVTGANVSSVFTITNGHIQSCKAG
jgi:hypothetical protein